MDKNSSDLTKKLEKLLEILNDGEAFLLLRNDVNWIKNILKWIWIPLGGAILIDLIIGVFK